MRDPYLAVVGAVALERVVELWLSRRHVRRALAAGGAEHGRRHYPLLVAAHAGLLVGCVTERVLRAGGRVPVAVAPVPRGMLAGVVAAQTLRWWCIRSLGDAWTTRVVTVPGREPVRRGPYRLLKHPNYVAVAAEGVALPLAGDCRVTAAVFTAVNTGLLSLRIRVEDRALSG